MNSPEPIVRLRDLKRAFEQGGQRIDVLRGVNLDIMPGDVAAERLAKIFGNAGEMKDLLKSMLECGRQRAAGTAACS